ncbi:MAG: sterol desaturase family protein [Sphingomonas sp.]
MTPDTPDWAKIDLVMVSVPAMLALLVLEMLLARLRGTRSYEVKDTAASLMMGTGVPISILLTGWIGAAAYLAVYNLRLFDIGWTWGGMSLCFLVTDLTYYWGHRLMHECRLGWASHVVHHSSQHFNISTALRQEWTSNISLIFLTGLPSALIGFPPAMVALASGVIGVYQVWIHTEHVGKLGPFEWFMNTPSHHRVHHGTNPRYLDSNHGGFFIIWDRMFGTFVAERDDDPVHFGIVSNIGSFNPLRIVLHEWVAIGRDVAGARSPREVAGYILGPPGWSPDGSRDTSATLRQKWREAGAAAPAE